MTVGRRPDPRRARLLVLILVGLSAPLAQAAGFSELVLSGFELLKLERHEEAAGKFAAALDLVPASAPARKGLATACAAVGVARLRAGRLRESREFLERAVAAQPESAEYHLLLAQVIFRGADARAARAEVDRALDIAPDNAAARELSGDLYDREGQLNLAVGEWEAAAKSGDLHTLAGKIDRGRREMAAEAGMGRETSRYFAVLYEREVPRALVRDFFTVLDRAFDILHDKLGEYPRDAITVILYSRVAFKSVAMVPDWVGGLYDGKIRVPVGGLTTIEEAANLQDLLVHEMTHAFLRRMAPTGLPLWFEEGLATAFQGWDPGKIRAWLSEHPPRGPTTLGDVDRALRGRGGDVTAAYVAARLAVAELEEIRGQGAIRRIIGGVGAGEPFADVFREEMRLDVAEFEDRWRRSLP